MRALLVALFGLIASQAHAAAPARPCPYMTIGWSQQWSGQPITSVSYVSDQTILYVIFNSVTAQAFYGVPISVMQAFSSTQNPLSVYNSSVSGRYRQMFLFETDNCPLLVQNLTDCPLQSETLVNLRSEQGGPVLYAETPACGLPVYPAYLFTR